MTNTLTLWTTKVGSHLWGMDHPGSDDDLFSAYIVPTWDILSGRNAGGGAHFTETPERDLQNHEVGRWVDELIKMNLNYLEGLFSPFVVEARNPAQPAGSMRGTYLSQLQKLVHSGLSQQCYGSIHGMAVGNYQKYIVSGRDASQKRMRQVARTLVFGRELLATGRLEFNPVGETSATEILALLDQLDHAKETSPLPPSMPTDVRFFIREWLGELRRRQMEGTL